MVELVYSPQFLEHETFSHPECKERLKAIVSHLKAKGFNNFKKPSKIKESELLIVHEKELLEKLKYFSKVEESTPDNVFNKNTFEIAKLATGSALRAAELCFKDFSFSLARPPGHHVGKNFFSGFCYLNNIAFAVRSIQKKKKISRVLIIDFDLHHGNGTQDIFYEDESVFYFSTHQDPRVTFPFSGFESENNKHVLNVSLKFGTSEATYLNLFKKSINTIKKTFEPELVGVSAGFDLFSFDSLIGNMLDIRSTKIFFEIGKIITKLKRPVFAVLEGGYYLPKLGENTFNFLNAFQQFI